MKQTTNNENRVEMLQPKLVDSKKLNQEDLKNEVNKIIYRLKSKHWAHPTEERIVQVLTIKQECVIENFYEVAERIKNKLLWEFSRNGTELIFMEIGDLSILKVYISAMERDYGRQKVEDVIRGIWGYAEIKVADVRSNFAFSELLITCYQVDFDNLETIDTLKYKDFRLDYYPM